MVFGIQVMEYTQRISGCTARCSRPGLHNRHTFASTRQGTGTRRSGKPRPDHRNPLAARPASYHSRL